MNRPVLLPAGIALLSLAADAATKAWASAALRDRHRITLADPTEPNGRTAGAPVHVDYFTGDPGHPVLRWSVRDPRRRDFWGHAVIPSWYTEATTVLDLDGHPRPVQAEKQPAEVTVGADGFIR